MFLLVRSSSKTEADLQIYRCEQEQMAKEREIYLELFPLLSDVIINKNM